MCRATLRPPSQQKRGPEVNRERLLQKNCRHFSLLLSQAVRPSFTLMLPFASQKLVSAIFPVVVTTGCATLIYVDAAKELVEIKPNTSSYTE